MEGIIGQYKLEGWWNEFTEKEKDTIKTLYGDLTCIKGFDDDANGFVFLSRFLGWFKNPTHYNITVKIIKLADTMVGSEKRMWNRHSYFGQKVRSLYAAREIFPEVLDLAIKACKEQIAISREVGDECRNELIKSELRAKEYLTTMLEKEIQEGDERMVASTKSRLEQIANWEHLFLTQEKNAAVESVKKTIGLPVHTGYKQLCIIYEKQENWQEVIRLAEEAKAIGWVDGTAGGWDKRIEKARKKDKK